MSRRDRLFWPIETQITVCESEDDQSLSNAHMTLGGLIVFEVSVERGISERGRVAHPNAAGTYDDSSCLTRWSKANTTVKRSIFMDEFVYSISSDMMRIQQLDALGSDIATVPLRN